MERPRSPQPKAISRRRDELAKSPPPRSRRYSRSPVRARSPLAHRRDSSPYKHRNLRSPHPLQQGRTLSPVRNRFERRPFSPPRDGRSKYPEEINYRPRERFRSPPIRRSEHISRVPSTVSSRRSSPLIHPDRLNHTSSHPHSPTYHAAKPESCPRDAGYHEISLPPRKAIPSLPHSPLPASEPYRQRSPPVRERGDFTRASNPQSYSDTPLLSGSTSAYRNIESRPAPNDPISGLSSAYTREASLAPTPSASISMSAHNRPGSNSLLSAPTQPRRSFSRREPRETLYAGPGTSRSARAPLAAPYNSSSRQQHEPRPAPPEYVPNGPRSSYSGPSASHDAPRHVPPFRSNNSSSTTYPRTQRFTTNHLASLPTILPEGKSLPTLDPVAAKKISQLEEDADRLRKQIEEKQKEKRAGLREWETRERESRREGLRSELTEAQLEGLSGEIIGGTAF